MMALLACFFKSLGRCKSRDNEMGQNEGYGDGHRAIDAVTEVNLLM